MYDGKYGPKERKHIHVRLLQCLTKKKKRKKDLNVLNANKYYNLFMNIILLFYQQKIAVDVILIFNIDVDKI